MNQYLAEIRMFGGNFAPRGWALCQGQLLSMSQNDALFALLGTTYGGNGVQTFGLPDFRGRQIWEWLWKKRATSFSELTSLSKEVRKLLNNT